MERKVDLPDIGTLILEEGKERKEQRLIFSLEPQYNYLKEVISLNLQLSNTNINLLSYVPDGYKIETGYESFGAKKLFKKIQLISLNSKEDFYFTLHEVGHARDFIENAMELANPIYFDPFLIYVKEKHLFDILNIEGRAWEEAIKIIEETNIPKSSICDLHELIKGKSFNSYYSEMTSEDVLKNVAMNSGLKQDDLHQRLTEHYNSWLKKLGVD